jgi:CRP/FNR family transcriptional regulator
LALIDDGPRVATATAREQTVVVAVPAPPVLRLVADRPAFALALLRSLGVMVRRIDDAVSDLVLLDLSGRISKFLLSHVDAMMPDPTPDGLVPVVVAITQTELAQLVGGSRQQVNKALRDLEDRGAIVRDGSRVTGVRPTLLS